MTRTYLMPFSLTAATQARQLVDLEYDPGDQFDIIIPPAVLSTPGVTDIATVFANLRTDTQVSADLRLLFTTPDGAVMTFTSNVGTVVGNNLTWTPSFSEWDLYGSASNMDIVITVVDTAGRLGRAELLDQPITLVNTPPVGANKTVAMNVLQGSAPTFVSAVPADGATGILVSANPVLTFSRPLAWLAAGSIRIKRTADNTVFEDFAVTTDIGVGAGKMSISGSAITLTKTSNFLGGVSYYIDWDACFSNLGGIAVAAQASTTFLDFMTSAAAAPAQFGAGDWSVTDVKSADGTFLLNIATLPADNGSAITKLERQLDAGTWEDLGALTTGNYTVSGTYFTAHSVAIRAVNAIGNGTASATKSVTPKGIRLVGYRAVNGTGSTYTGTINAGLLGGSRAAVAANDYTAAILSWSSGTDDIPDITTASMVDIYPENYINVTSGNRLNSVAASVVQGGTPDVSIAGNGPNNGGRGGGLLIAIFEGVDTTTPHDVAPVIGSAVSGSILPTPPAITPVTQYAVIYSFSAGAYGSATLDVAPPANMTSIAVRKTETATRSNYANAAYHRWTGGTFTPNANTLSAGVDSTLHSSKAITVALRPA